MTNHQMPRWTEPHVFFLLLGVPFMLALVFATPPFLVFDEETHLYRAYQVSELGMVAKKSPEGRVGGRLPRALEQLVTFKPVFGLGGNPEGKIMPRHILAMRAVRLDTDDRMFLRFPNSAFYTPVSYIPQALALAVGRLCTDSMLALFYLARLANVAVWLALIYCAIRVTPILKWVFVLLAFMPKTVYQSASLSTDTLILAMSFLTTAWILRLAYGPDDRVRRRDLGILFVCAVVLSLCKQAYFLIPLLYFLIPVRRVGGWGRYLGFFLAMMGTVAALLAGWSLIVNEIFVNIASDVDPGEQVRFVLSHPFEYAKILVTTLLRETSMTKFLGRLGWHDTAVPELLIWGHLIALLVATCVERPDNIRISLRDRVVVLVVLVASVTLFATLLYVTWNPVGNLAIRGIQQGRYYIPLFPMVFLLIYNVRLPGRLLLLAGTLVSLCWTLKIVVERYYGW